MKALASRPRAGEHFLIKHRFTGAVIFDAELSAEISRQPLSIKLGAATKLALNAGASLANANLAGANLAGAYLVNASLANANLARANLANANLVNANLANANLANANLAGAYLANANLAGANLAGAYLVNANLANANLAGAYLAGANLAGAYLAGANLANANLAGANLANANLANANLAGANLADVKDVIAAGQPNDFWALGYREKDTGTLRIKVGCRDKSIAEARAYWSPAHPHWPERQEIPPVLDMIEAIARLRGWLEIDQ